MRIDSLEHAAERCGEDDNSLNWKLNGSIWHDWSLFDGSRQVAHLKSRRRFSIFEATYNERAIEIRKESGGRVVVSDEGSNAKIGEFNRVFPSPVMFVFSNGTRYSISKDGRGVFAMKDESGKIVSITEFHIEKRPVRASFRAIESNEQGLNRWLGAILSLYVAIMTSYSN